jgi:hypothetical protein
MDAHFSEKCSLATGVPGYWNLVTDTRPRDECSILQTLTATATNGDHGLFFVDLDILFSCQISQTTAVHPKTAAFLVFRQRPSSENTEVDHSTFCDTKHPRICQEIQSYHICRISFSPG